MDRTSNQHRHSVVGQKRKRPAEELAVARNGKDVAYYQRQQQQRYCQGDLRQQRLQKLKEKYRRMKEQQSAMRQPDSSCHDTLVKNKRDGLSEFSPVTQQDEQSKKKKGSWQESANDKAVVKAKETSILSQRQCSLPVEENSKDVAEKRLRKTKKPKGSSLEQTAPATGKIPVSFDVKTNAQNTAAGTVGKHNVQNLLPMSSSMNAAESAASGTLDQHCNSKSNLSINDENSSPDCQLAETFVDYTKRRRLAKRQKRERALEVIQACEEIPNLQHSSDALGVFDEKRKQPYSKDLLQNTFNIAEVSLSSFASETPDLTTEASLASVASLDCQVRRRVKLDDSCEPNYSSVSCCLPPPKRIIVKQQNLAESENNYVPSLNGNDHDDEVHSYNDDDGDVNKFGDTEAKNLALLEVNDDDARDTRIDITSCTDSLLFSETEQNTLNKQVNTTKSINKCLSIPSCLPHELDTKKRNSSVATNINVKNALVPFVAVGRRMKVFRDGDDNYWKGTVKRRKKSGKKVFVEYDNGDEEWVDLSKSIYKLLRVQNTTTTKQEKDEVNTTFQDQFYKTEVQGAFHSTGVATQNDDMRALNAFGVLEKNIMPTQSVVTTSGSQAKVKTDKFVVSKKLKTSPYGAHDSNHGVEWDSRRVASSKYAVSDSNDDWVAAGISKSSESDSDTDEDEIMDWAVKMFGIKKRTVCHKASLHDLNAHETDFNGVQNLSLKHKSRSKDVGKLKHPDPKIEKDVQEGELIHASKIVEKNGSICENKTNLNNDSAELSAAAKKQKKESARPLSAAELSSIFEQDKACNQTGEHWVRRSVRQPSKCALSSPLLLALIDNLRNNDSDMVVLKMKKYISDPDAPTIVLDAALDALEENTNCEALYIQNFNEGMRDAQVLHLLRILQQQSCKIWCLNIGETYKVRMKTWRKFARGLQHTNVTHMYASEHTITPELKDLISSTIRNNRKKHNMHIDPDNLETIVRCTHCWWNPINAKILRPFIKKKGIEHILEDAEAQGLKGSTSGASIGRF